MGDDEAQAAELSCLPSLPASVCVYLKLEHWSCNVNKCHVVFDLCRRCIYILLSFLLTIAPEELL